MPETGDPRHLSSLKLSKIPLAIPHSSLPRFREFMLSVLSTLRVECTAFQSCDQPPSTGISAPVVKVASNARKRTALAISSDVPQRFIGIIPIIFSLIWAASSLPVNTLAMIGVSMGPARHRVDANLARKQLGGEHPSEGSQRGLAAPYAALPGMPLTLAIEVVKTMEPPRLIRGASFCTAKSGPLAFKLNISS